MKYIKQIPKTNAILSKELIAKGWKELKEPKNVWISMIYSLPISMTLFISECLFIYNISDDFKNIPKMLDNGIEIDLINLLIFIITLILFYIIHEFIHALFTPNILKSNKIFWGFNGLYGFVYSEEIISRNRFILVSLAPTVILSIILPIVLKLFGVLNNFWNLLCIFHIAGACVDILNICLIMWQIPKNGKLLNNGIKTFYRVGE